MVEKCECVDHGTELNTDWLNPGTNAEHADRIQNSQEL